MVSVELSQHEEWCNRRRAGKIESDFFSHAEAEFALWDMAVRERDIAHAIDVARRPAHDFPDNRELTALRRLARRVYGDERSGVTGTAISSDCTLTTA